MARVVDIESTPNPNALKFVLDEALLTAGVRSFDSKDLGQNDPLAAALFALDGVQSVFYMGRFVTVSKNPEVGWGMLQSQIIETVQTKAKDVQASSTTVNGTSNGTQNPVLSQVNDVIDRHIRPALAGDGGGLEVLSIDGYTVSIHYQGACGSCPSATAGTMYAIQNLLQRMVDPRIRVVSG